VTCVAIHQPNYLPWLGYFHKLSQADIFVFLDDVQFSKGSYTNRVQILTPSGVKWLTIPVKVNLGQAITEVCFADFDWRTRHIDILSNAYVGAPEFSIVWPEIKEIILDANVDSLAEVNISLVTSLASKLGVICQFRRSSELQLASGSDDRLIEITSQLAPGGTYLSGKGGAKYQDPEKFLRAGLNFAYLSYDPPAYQQSHLSEKLDFVPGLSVLDAIFHLGWKGTAELIAEVRV